MRFPSLWSSHRPKPSDADSTASGTAPTLPTGTEDSTRLEMIKIVTPDDQDTRNNKEHTATVRFTRRLCFRNLIWLDARIDRQRRSARRSV